VLLGEQQSYSREMSRFQELTQYCINYPTRIYCVTGGRGGYGIYNYRCSRIYVCITAVIGTKY
jgi:hypothetical protein